jgi:hypothetical protein
MKQPLGQNLEPDVRDKATIPRQILETVKTVKAPERNVGHVFRLSETKVDSDPRSTVLPWLQAAPTDQVAANAAEVE